MKDKYLRQNLHAFRNLVDAHFIGGEYRCELCGDYFPGTLCDGKGYTTEKECLDCMREKFEQGERVIIYSGPFGEDEGE